MNNLIAFVVGFVIGLWIGPRVDKKPTVQVVRVPSDKG